jgi:Sec-independent protein translocase protein TatA
VGFGIEILFILLLGLLVLGPKQMHVLLGHVARAKAPLENARRDFKSRLAIELDAQPQRAEPITCATQVGSSKPFTIA